MQIPNVTKCVCTRVYHKIVFKTQDSIANCPRPQGARRRDADSSSHEALRSPGALGGAGAGGS